MVNIFKKFFGEMLIVWALAIAAFCIQDAVATGMTIKEIKADPGTQSLWQFLVALPVSFEAQVFYGLALFGFVGMLGHYFKQWKRREIVGNPLRYLFLDNPFNTLFAYGGVLVTALGAIAMNVFTDDAGHFVGWLNVMGWGLMAGYTLDSTANKGAQTN